MDINKIEVAIDVKPTEKADRLITLLKEVNELLKDITIVISDKA